MPRRGEREPEEDDDGRSPREVDLHGLTTAQAERRALQELHAARVRREERVVLITGRGYGNRLQEPVLRRHLEAWLGGPDAQRLGVRSFRVTARGGALEVSLG